jgi:hypothetical protein
VCYGATRGGTLEVSLQGSNAQLPISLITSLYCSILSCVLSCSFSLVML